MRVAIRCLRPSGIGRHNQRLLQLHLAQVLHHYWRGVQVVNGNIKKSLYLLGMQIHREDAIGSGRHQQIGDELCGNRYAWLIFAILARVAIIREYSRDAFRGATTACVNHDQELHEHLVGLRADGLYNEDIHAADVVFNLDMRFAIRKTTNLRIAQLGTQIVHHLFCQWQVCCS